MKIIKKDIKWVCMTVYLLNVINAIKKQNCNQKMMIAYCMSIQ